MGTELRSAGQSAPVRPVPLGFLKASDTAWSAAESVVGDLYVPRVSAIRSHTSSTAVLTSSVHPHFLSPSFS